jgi:DNA polymerase elongation subunit (family B)
MEHIFRIFDFNICNKDLFVNEDISSEEEEHVSYKDKTKFIIQMFGLNEIGETASIIIDDFKPFFYVMVDDTWKIKTKESFLLHIKDKIGEYYKNSITECILLKKKKLYGFDGNKEHKFIKFEFTSMNAFNKVKNIWFSEYQTNEGRKLLKDGYKFNNTYTKLYEANIPPLLRFFHIRDISPSGWIALPKKNTLEIKRVNHNLLVGYISVYN